MSISGMPGTGAADTPGAALSGMAASLHDLAGTFWAARSDDELVQVVEQVATMRSVLAAVEAGAVAEADARGVAQDTLHYGSTGDWLTHIGGLRKGEGRRVVARARAVTGPLAATGAALAEGSVSQEQADVIIDAVERLPSSPLTRRRGEQRLLDDAAGLDASDLARAGRHLVHVVDPDHTDRRLENQLEREERAAHLTRGLSIRDDGAGGVRLRGRGTVEDAAILKAALLPLTTPAPAADDHRGDLVHDPRDHGARMWDALVQVAQHALDVDLPPETHGARPRLLVTLDHDALKAGVLARGLGHTGDGVELSPATVRRLACDADLIPAVLGTHGEVLDVGRVRRLVTPAIWTALVLRDGHCAFPACTRPPVMCHAHHVTHWADGGPSSLDNLVLLCGHHHRVIHHTPWEIHLNPSDHKPEFLPPPKPGHPRTPIRHRPRRT